LAEAQTDAPEIPGLAALSWLFARALWQSKQYSAGKAYLAIKTATNAEAKSEIIQAQFEAWNQGSVSTIKEFFPQYVDLGCRYKHLLNSDPVEWAAARAWDSLRGQYGVNRLDDYNGSHSFRSMKWWLAVASESNSKVNLEDAESWRAPRWLVKSRSLIATNQVLQNFLDGLSLTFFDVLYEEKERARVRVALNDSSPTDPQQGGSFTPSSKQPQIKGRKKVLTRAESQRYKVIFGAIESGLKSLNYCRMLDERRLPVPTTWTECGCPSKYVDAYKTGSKWQKRIQDEKNRYKKKYDQTSPKEREKLLKHHDPTHNNSSHSSLTSKSGPGPDQ
jgi:hypothetical protein